MCGLPLQHTPALGQCCPAHKAFVRRDTHAIPKSAQTGLRSIKPVGWPRTAVYCLRILYTANRISK